MLQFDYPLAFLLLPLPLLVYWLSGAYRDRGQALRVPFFQRLVELTGQQPRAGAVVIRKTLLQRAVLALSWLLIVLALARPEWAGEPIVREIAARDLLLIVDLSGSMEAQDFSDAEGAKVTRLQAVKQVLDEFISRRQGDRLGLAVFGDAAFPQTPFTEDHATVRTLLDELQPRMAGPKTMMGDAIGLAVRLFDASDKDNKVAILLTDGNDSGSQMPVTQAARIAAERGITLYSIAIGDPTTVGEDALDTGILETIAELTGGRFFLALDRAELDAIYAELDKL
ncbi:MAG: VWA domain-containing protein, partial [Candidatus Competibacteraceae bacterium]|nr:VWA domain-containing protein [Candidatus Competibacteraceae bacterium]